MAKKIEMKYIEELLREMMEEDAAIVKGAIKRRQREQEDWYRAQWVALESFADAIGLNIKIDFRSLIPL